jgi:hypothetical protein
MGFHCTAHSHKDHGASMSSLVREEGEGTVQSKRNGICEYLVWREGERKTREMGILCTTNPLPSQIAVYMHRSQLQRISIGECVLRWRERNEKNLKEREREREKRIKNLCVGEQCQPSCRVILFTNA